jgi:hypothetical protein
MRPDDTLKNCPLCRYPVDDDEFPFPANRDRTVWIIRCHHDKCNFGVESGPTAEIAVEQWNRLSIATKIAANVSFGPIADIQVLTDDAAPCKHDRQKWNISFTKGHCTDCQKTFDVVQ